MPPDDATDAASFATVLAGVMRYLVRHPDAKDTAAGILEWWRPASGAAWSAEDVHAVLDFLSRRDWITVRGVGEDVKLYGSNFARLGDMKAFLAEMQRSGHREQEE